MVDGNGSSTILSCLHRVVRRARGIGGFYKYTQALLDTVCTSVLVCSSATRFSYIVSIIHVWRCARARESAAAVSGTKQQVNKWTRFVPSIHYFHY